MESRTNKPYILMLSIWVSKRETAFEVGKWPFQFFNFGVHPPSPEYKKPKISSAIFLPWIYHEFSLNPPRRVIQMSMKDGGIVAKLGHHEELFANYLFFVANFGNQIFTIPPYSAKKKLKW